MKIDFVWGADWTGIYINGVLKREDHSLDAIDVLEVLEEAGQKNINIIEADDDWLASVGRLPGKLKDVWKVGKE